MRIRLIAMLLLLPALAQAETLYVRPSATCPNNGDGILSCDVGRHLAHVSCALATVGVSGSDDLG